MALGLEPELCCLAAAAAAAAAFKLLLILLLSGRPLRQARAAASTMNDGGPAPASPGAAGRHQHESDRHGDCQAGTEWRDRPGQYKPDSDSAGSDRARSPRHPGPGRPAHWHWSARGRLLGQGFMPGNDNSSSKQYFNNN